MPVFSTTKNRYDAVIETKQQLKEAKKMKKTIITTVLAALSVSTAMAASIANFTNETEQQNPYAQSNAQVQSQAVDLEQVNYGKVNGKVVNPLFKYTGQSTAGQVSAETSSVRVSH